jgi:hypothetical protein
MLMVSKFQGLGENLFLNAFIWDFPGVLAVINEILR